MKNDIEEIKNLMTNYHFKKPLNRIKEPKNYIRTFGLKSELIEDYKTTRKYNLIEKTAVSLCLFTIFFIFFWFSIIPFLEEQYGYEHPFKLTFFVILISIALHDIYITFAAYSRIKYIKLYHQYSVIGDDFYESLIPLYKCSGHESYGIIDDYKNSLHKWYGDVAVINSHSAHTYYDNQLKVSFVEFLIDFKERELNHKK